MSSFGHVKQVYNPGDLKVMSAAFDKARSFLPHKIKANDRAGRRLALLIMRHANRGENDPERLAVSAVLDFLR
jgi:hypothetical protein